MATGLQLDRTSSDLRKMFSSVGEVEKTVRIVDSAKKFTGKAYIVYASADSVGTACLNLSKGGVVVQAAKDASEFESLVQEEEEENQDELALLKHWQQLTTEQQWKMMKMMQMKPVHSPGASAGASAGAAAFFADSPVVLQDKPHVPSFSGSGKDCSFGRWKYEVDCLEQSGAHTEATILDSVRKSLKTPAADCLPLLGVNPTLAQVVDKIQSVYGSVLSGETLLEQFYKAEQEDESCAQWSLKLEDLIFQASQKGALASAAIPSALKNKFWSGLKDANIKNALRHRYKELDFTAVVAEARSIEAEDSPVDKKSARAKSHQATVEDSKLDLLIKKMERMEADIRELKEERKGKKDASDKKKGPLICTKCNLEGHFSWGCRDGQDFVCARCNQKGHTPKSCRNKKSASKDQ